MRNFFSTGLASTFNSILIPVTLSFAAGIAVSRSLSQNSNFLFVAALLTAACSFLCFILRRRHLQHILLLLFFFLIGSLHIAPYLKPPQATNHIYNQIDKKQMATIVGRLQKMPISMNSSTGTRSRLLMAVSSLRRPDGDAQGMGSTVVDSSGLIQLTINGPPPDGLEPGDLFMAKGLLNRVRGYSLPDSFDYKEYLSTQSIWITGWVKSPALVIRLEEIHGQKMRHRFTNLLFWPERIRYQLFNFIDATVAPQNSGLYKALLIGDRHDVSQELIEAFKKTGCMHLLAISGMHMGLLALLFITGTNWLLKRSTWLILHLPILKTAAVLSLIPLTGYAFIAGFNTPVVRALIMTLTLSMATVINRKQSIMNSVALAALLILIWEPASLFTASFQLSFAAVITIAALYPRIYNLLSSPKTSANNNGTRNDTFRNRLANWTATGLIISAAALAGTAPLMIYHFNRISLVSPFTNLFIQPFLCLWSLPAGLLGCAVLPISSTLAQILLHIGSYGIRISSWLVTVFAKIPFADLWLSTPSITEIICYYTLLFCLLLPCPPIRKIQFSRKAVITLCLLFITIIPVTQKISRKFSTRTTVTILDVGQGSSTHITFPGGQNMLIDGGGQGSARFNVGEALIAPYLWNMRIHRLDDLIISHPHADHYNGLAFIIKRFKPDRLWINGQAEGADDYQGLLNLARQSGTDVRICSPGSNITQHGPVTLACLASPEEPMRTRERSGDLSLSSKGVNRGSMVLKLTHKSTDSRMDKAFLFPGDINKEEEAELLALQRSALDADVLLAPHHGSRNSNSLDFLQAVSPDYLVISTGSPMTTGDSEGYLADFCRKSKTALLTTAANGTISFTVQDADLSMETL
jgi:competence protein ComEC